MGMDSLINSKQEYITRRILDKFSVDHRIRNDFKVQYDKLTGNINIWFINSQCDTLKDYYKIELNPGACIHVYNNKGQVEYSYVATMNYDLLVTLLKEIKNQLL